MSWKSSNKSVATVSSKGKVRAKKVGTTVITAVNAKKSYRCNITVSNKNTKTLIVYYSWSGETKKAATKIKKAINADMVRIQPRKAYSKDYDTTVDVAQKELEDNARPAVSTRILNMSQYDTVLVGYPIWWQDAPMLIRTFLEKHNLKGKTIIPFCTSAGSGISGSMSSIRESTSGANVKGGRDLTDDSQAQVKRWLDNVITDANNSDANTDNSTNDNNNDSNKDNNVNDNNNDSNADNNNDANINDDNNNTSTDSSGNGESGKTLVAYFSWSGTSQRQAEYIASQTGGTLYQIEREVPYSDDYNTVAYGVIRQIPCVPFSIF